jgi:Chromo (CHRromatin Organisation MOdifier) domain
MFLNAFTDRSRPERQKGSRKERLAFDFVVAERPIYIPGSGPPLAPVTVMPADDKDGIIQGEVKMDKQPRYIVSYEAHPYLRVSVKPQNILDWVSPRTLEDWEFAKTQAEDQAERDELLPKIAAREQRKKLKEQGGETSRGTDGPKKTWSRKRKRPPTPEPPSRSGTSGRKRKGLEEQDTVDASPRRPSLSTPVRQRGLADLLDLDDSEDEDSFAEETAELLDRQLNGTPGRSKLTVEVSRSATTSPEPQPLEMKKPKKPTVPTFDRRETRSASISSTPGKGRETRSASTSGPSSRHASVAATSSREARAIYEKLERKSRAKSSALTKTYSYSGKPPSSSQRLVAANHPKHSTPKRKKSATPKPVEKDDDESEYEVDAILADEYRMDKEGPVLWYLIKWVGDWDNTWEPAENVGTDAIKEYKAKKAAEQERMDTPSKLKPKMSYDGAEDASDDTMDDDLKGKGKQKVPFGSGGRGRRVRDKEKGKQKKPLGGGLVDLTAEESDPDSLFVHDTSPAKRAPVQKRGEVIDDAGLSDEF